MPITRIGVTSPYPTDQLGRASRRMAEKSVNRLSEPKIANRIKALNRLLRAERQCKLKLGDKLIELIDEDHLRPVDLARTLHERANYLSELHHVSRMFRTRPANPIFNLSGGIIKMPG